MNHVMGTVVHKETGIGIENLLVVVYDIDPAIEFKSLFATENQIQIVSHQQKSQVVRLGSTLTTEEGDFEVTYEDDDFRSYHAEEKRPDLFVCVFAPEGATSSNGLPIIHKSPEIRWNAGRSETYLIYVTTEQLKNAKTTIPSNVSTEPEKTEETVARLIEEEVERQAFERGMRQISAKRINRKFKIREHFNSNARKPILDSVSRILNDDVKKESFIATEENAKAVTDKTKASIKKQLDTVINQPSKSGKRAPIKGYITLTDQAKKTLQSAGTIIDEGKQIVDVPGEKLDALFGNTTNSSERSSYFLQIDSVKRFCRDKTSGEKCLEDENPDTPVINGDDDENDTSEDPNRPVVNGNGEDDENDTDEDPNRPIVNGNGEDNENNTNESTNELDSLEAVGTGVDLSSEDGVPRYIASLTESVDVTQSPIVFNPDETVTQDKIQHAINTFSMQVGPADVPAFYDFHQLNIAFEHIWQEAIDRDILKNAEDLYEAIVELGIDPGSGTIDDLCEKADSALKEELKSPPPNVASIFEITDEQWNVLKKKHRTQLKDIAKLFFEITNHGKHLIKDNKEFRLPVSAIHPDERTLDKHKKDFRHIRSFHRYLAQQRRNGQRIIQYAQSKLDRVTEYSEIDFTQYHSILKQLRKRLKSDYSFIGFAAKKNRHSVNFGILLTYRQKWIPQNYQVGELVKTVTLAPKEVRKFTKKTVHKRKRSEKEVENSLYSRRDESNITSRAEAEIVRNAQSKTNFTTTASGSFNVGVWGADASASFNHEASKSSNEAKKAFREAVVKSTEEYKNERKTEVSAEESFEEEYTESGEIMNPNEEITVTFLFYELQRRYKVTEKLHRVLPVVFVAQEIPNPADIDEDWIITHDWILRRVILDDTFIPAMNYITTKIVGDEFSLKEMKKHVEQLRRTMEDLRDEVVEYRELVGQRYSALERAIERSAQAVEDDDGGGLFGFAKDVIPGGSLIEKGVDLFTGGDTSPEAARVRERAARDAYEKAMQDEREVMSRLNRAIATHNAAMEEYTKKLGEHLNRRAQVSRLLVHIKQNILYYMQAIWLHEPHDQRFLRLHKVEIPVLKGKKTYKFKPSAKGILRYDEPIADNMKMAPLYEYEVDVNIEPAFDTKPLVEVADIDNLLGFKGNYMIFRLKEPNVLTEFMMEPYIDREWNTVYDPDIEGSMTLDEFSDYVCCLKDKLQDQPEVFEGLKPELRKLLRELLISPLRDNEDIVVPTDSLYIDALPGTHAVLEKFKLMHRAIDVNLADAEQKEQMLENIRRVARLLDDQLEDPDIEAKYVFEGNANASFNAPTDNNNSP